MIGYTMVGTDNLIRARDFYNPLFEKMSLTLCYEDQQVVSWGDRNNDAVPRFFVCYPYNNKPATIGNGTMVAFNLRTASDVNDLYHSAIRAGAIDEGTPGFRPERYGDKFYVAYVRDPDGNKLAFACYDGLNNP